MKRINKIAWISLCAMVCLLIPGTDLFAAEEAGGWRETYDPVSYTHLTLPTTPYV